MKKPFEIHEAYCQEALGLDTTAGSGSQWHDIGDGTTRDQYSKSFRLMIDAKSTVKGSYSVKEAFMAGWVDKAIELGKRFALPIRFLKPNGHHQDYVVLTMDDFVELLEMAGQK